MKNILAVGNESNIIKRLNFKHDKRFNFTYTSRRYYDNKHIFYFDITDVDFLKKFELILDKTTPSIVLWCIGYTNIEKCQNDASTYDLNVTRTNSIVNLIYQKNINFVYFSTNAVFSCDSQINSDKEEYSPTCEYGNQKVEVEKYISKKTSNSAIIRLSKLISLDDHFFKLIQKKYHGKKIRLFSDIYIAPITYNYLNSFLILLLSDFKPGIFNLSASFIINYVDLIKLLNNNKVINVKTSSFDKIANSDVIFKPRYPIMPMTQALKVYNFSYLNQEQFLCDLL